MGKRQSTTAKGRICKCFIALVKPCFSHVSHHDFPCCHLCLLPFVLLLCWENSVSVFSKTPITWLSMAMRSPLGCLFLKLNKHCSLCLSLGVRYSSPVTIFAGPVAGLTPGCQRLCCTRNPRLGELLLMQYHKWQTAESSYFPLTCWPHG